MVNFKLPWAAEINGTHFDSTNDDNKATMAGEEMSEDYLNHKLGSLLFSKKRIMSICRV